MDDSATLTKIDFGGRSFNYRIKLSANIADKPLIISKLNGGVKSNWTDKGVSYLLKSNFAVQYIYSDATTDNLVTLTVSKADCPNL